MTRPPADADLDAALALGGTRVATFAHPNCVCRKPHTPACPVCQARPGQPCHATDSDPQVLSPTGLARAHRRTTRQGTPQDCPMHRDIP